MTFPPELPMSRIFQAYKRKTEAAKKDYLKALAAYRASLVSKVTQSPGKALMRVTGGVVGSLGPLGTAGTTESCTCASHWGAPPGWQAVCVAPHSIEFL